MLRSMVPFTNSSRPAHMRPRPELHETEIKTPFRFSILNFQNWK